MNGTFSPALCAYLPQTILEGLELLKESNGTANRIYHNGPFLVRKKVVDHTDLPFQGPVTEKAVYDFLGFDNAFTPELMFFDGESGDKIEAFIEGNPLDKANGKTLCELALCLHGLHSQKPKDFLPKFRAIERYQHYKNLAKTELSNQKEAQIIEEIVPLFQDDSSSCLCHNDLWSGNILVTDSGRINLLDLEFAGTNHPYFDLASVIEENRLSEIESESFLKAYFRRAPTEDETKQIHALVNFHHILWFYWAEARYLETGNPTFLDIAKIKQDDFENA